MSPDPALDEAMSRMALAIGTPKRLKSPVFATLCALISYMGHLERLTLRATADSMFLVHDGHRSIPVEAHADLTIPRILAAPPRAVEKVAKRIITQMGRRTHVSISSAIWLTVLAHVTGQLAALHGIPLTAVETMSRSAWAKTTDADVEEFQRMKRPIAIA